MPRGPYSSLSTTQDRPRQTVSANNGYPQSLNVGKEKVDGARALFAKGWTWNHRLQLSVITWTLEQFDLAQIGKELFSDLRFKRLFFLAFGIDIVEGEFFAAIQVVNQLHPLGKGFVRGPTPAILVVRATTHLVSQRLLAYRHNVLRLTVPPATFVCSCSDEPAPPTLRIRFDVEEARAVCVRAVVARVKGSTRGDKRAGRLTLSRSHSARLKRKEQMSVEKCEVHAPRELTETIDGLRPKTLRNWHIMKRMMKSFCVLASTTIVH